MNPVLCLIFQTPSVQLNPDGRMEEHPDARTSPAKSYVLRCPGSSNQHYVAEGDRWKLVLSNGEEGLSAWSTREVLENTRNPATTFRNLRSNDLCALRDGKLVLVEEQFHDSSTARTCDEAGKSVGGKNERLPIATEGTAGSPSSREMLSGQVQPDPISEPLSAQAPIVETPLVLSPAAPTDGEMLDWLDRHAFKIEVCHGGEIETLYSSILSNWKHPSHAIVHAMQQEQQAK